ncbi:MAG TPA: hypothetical protein VLZ03_02190 [Thermodesulfobacteriota bacterium]|jgi:hypothetical protein|nr:hypothetical protein [Thermodesulfobacteriota bacterium]
MRIVPDKYGGVPNHFSFHKRGNWFHQCLENPSMSYTAVSGRLYAVPLYVGEDVPVDGIRIYVASGVANAHARIGIYSNAIGKNAMPDKLLYQSPELDCSTSGYKGDYWQWETRPRMMLKAGKLYWLAVLTDADVLIYHSSMPVVWMLGFVGIETGTDPRPVTYLHHTTSYGNLPNPYPGPTGFGSYLFDSHGYAPVIYVRAAYKQRFNISFQLTPGASYYTGEIGLIGGGQASGGASAEIDGVRFNSETLHNPSAALSVARNLLGAVHSSSRGYWAGGLSGSNSNEIDGIQFDTEGAVNPSATLPTARRCISGVHSATRGYFGGGYTSGAVNEIDGIQFDNETAINPSATLSNNRYNTGGVNSADKGYWGGGWDSSFSAEIDGIQFSNETAVNPGTALATARRNAGGVNYPGVRGYWGGGYKLGGSGYCGDIDGINYSDETLQNPVAELWTYRDAPTGVNSNARGYWLGGYTNTYVGDINGLNYSDEAAFYTTATLSVARQQGAGVQSGGIV